METLRPWSFAPLAEHQRVVSLARDQCGDAEISVTRLTQQPVAAQVRRQDTSATHDADADRSSHQVGPFALQGERHAAVVASVVTVAISLGLGLICLLKQRLWHGTIGLLIPPLPLYGAIRLGKPGSAWAKRRYGARNPGKQARAEARFAPDRRSERLKRTIRDAVGGTPQDEYEAKLRSR